MENIDKYKFELEKMKSYLETQRKSATCPYCQTNTREIVTEIYELRAYRGGNITIGGVPIVPVVPVVCSNCGNTVLVNAVKSHLLDLPKKDGSTQSK